MIGLSLDKILESNFFQTSNELGVPLLISDGERILAATKSAEELTGYQLNNFSLSSLLVDDSVNNLHYLFKSDETWIPVEASQTSLEGGFKAIHLTPRDSIDSLIFILYWIKMIL